MLGGCYRARDRALLLALYDLIGKKISGPLMIYLSNIDKSGGPFPFSDSDDLGKSAPLLLS